MTKTVHFQGGPLHTQTREVDVEQNAERTVFPEHIEHVDFENPLDPEPTKHIYRHIPRTCSYFYKGKFR